MNREELKTLLPHREPMLLIDQAEVRDNVAYGTYHVTGKEWFLQGHYPGNPIVPGVVLLEIMAQTCGILLGEEIKGKTPYYTGVERARFKKMVRPGDVICVEAGLTRQKSVFYFTSCKAKVDDELCASGELSFAVMEG